jgi:hypothetical protein
VIGAVEQAALPLVAVASRIGGDAAIGDPGLELAAIRALVAECFGDRAAVGDQPVGVKVQRDPRVRGERMAGRSSGTLPS